MEICPVLTCPVRDLFQATVIHFCFYARTAATDKHFRARYLPAILQLRIDDSEGHFRLTRSRVYEGHKTTAEGRRRGPSKGLKSQAYIATNVPDQLWNRCPGTQCYITSGWTHVSTAPRTKGVSERTIVLTMGVLAPSYSTFYTLVSPWGNLSSRH